MKWTKEQQNVIDFRNRDILVSAAAGSGKTAVLVARIIQRILDPQNPVDIDRLLVVTFTKAAAAEMRERIGAAIEAECEKDPQNTHLRRQSALIHNAMITTIDSFCLFVVRNHFEEISLDPNFRIADEGEIRLLEQDVLEQVFEDNYARQEKTFLSLIDAYAGKRNDHGVREMVAKIYRMSLSSPWPQAWMKKLTEPYQVEHAQELVQTEMLEDIAEHARLLLCDMCTQMTQALQLCNEPDGPQAYAKTLEADLTQLQQAENLQGYLQVQTFLNGLVFGKLSPIRKFSGDVKKKETVMEIRSDVKKEVETLQKKYFAMDLETLLLQQKRLCPFLEELVRLALEYTQAMETAKRKKRIVDFADIEHFALRILVDEKTKQPRHTAEEFRRHFAEIMIDEYQDSNQVQEEIMRAISMEPEGGHNLFMVGDVKQSIYRFRLARPELFMDKYASFSTEESLQQRIDLHMNFRSGVIKSAAYLAEETGFKLIVSAKTADGFEFSAEKTVAIQNEHSGGTATCTEQATCEICGEKYGDLKPHSYSVKWSTGEASHWHECTKCRAKTDEAEHTDTNKDHKCDVCDKVLSECTDTNKDHKCDLCGKALSEHSGGKATCKDKAKCEFCGESYGELNANNHSDLKHFPAVAATKTAEGNIEYWYCEGCGKYYSDKDGTKEIKKADTVTAKLKDDSKSPQTGDTSNLALWIALLFISGGVAIGTTIVSRKKKYNR